MRIVIAPRSRSPAATGSKTGPPACCKTCTNSQPCGDSCISLSESCHKALGCACAE